MARIAIAMSGGVDSSVAALLLKQEGHQLLGLHMKLHHGKSHEKVRKRCCSLDEALDARAICNKLDIPFYVLDFQKEFKEDVMDYFIYEYQQGQTPNPCVMCNRKIKSGPLIRKSMELECEYLATGHYASVRKNINENMFQLVRPADSEKDQTYFLHGISNFELKKMIFPLAKLKKKEVQKLALEHQLFHEEKEESQEICFVPKDYRQFLETQVEDPPVSGRFVDTNGNDLGRHRGLMYYTVGQRRGLGISDSTPFYVTRLNTKNNEVVLGKKEDLLCSIVEVESVNWVSAKPRKQPFSATVKLRYSHKETSSTIIPIDEEKVRILLDEPQSSVSPGQAAVFYEKEVVLGGGWIVSTSPYQETSKDYSMEIPA
jgi:tRNA-specific 2-thiouridylase